MSAAQAISDEARRTYLGSHDTSAISGLNPYRKPINVFMDKLAMSTPQEPTERMRWGLSLQSAILAEFADRIGGVELEPEHFIRHSSLPWFGGTPDATIAGRKAGVDAKNVQFNRGEWGEEHTDQVPRYILFQCHHFLALTGYDVWHVAALFGGCEFKIYDIERDNELAEMIIEMDGRFWSEHIQMEIPPEVDDSEGWKKYAERMHPRDNGLVRAATDDELVLFRELRDTANALKRYGRREDELKNMLRNSIGDDAGIDCGEFGRVSYRLGKGRETIDTAILKAQYPAIAKECTRTGKPKRMLRPTFKEA